MINFPAIDKFGLVIGSEVGFVGDIVVDARVSVSGQVQGQVRVSNLRAKGSVGQGLSCRESVLVHSKVVPMVACAV